MISKEAKKFLLAILSCCGLITGIILWSCGIQEASRYVLIGTLGVNLGVFLDRLDQE